MERFCQKRVFFCVHSQESCIFSLRITAVEAGTSPADECSKGKTNVPPTIVLAGRIHIFFLSGFSFGAEAEQHNVQYEKYRDRDQRIEEHEAGIDLAAEDF